ncbi:MAG: SRPBCC family protein [Almyronema sp.]
MNCFWLKWLRGCVQAIARQPHTYVKRSLASTYQAVSSASADVLWQVVANLADVSWHPLLRSTNAPNGLMAKPGLIYKASTHCFPLPIHIFVERVDHRELLSVRVYVLPGLEERVTYQIESTVCGTRIFYSVTLRGWLSPLAWSLIRPHAAKVAAALADAAEQTARQALVGTRPSTSRPSQDLLG